MLLEILLQLADELNLPSWTARNLKAAYDEAASIPEDREIRVTCDEPKCVRPSHTEIGEQRARLLTMPRMGARQQLEFWRSVKKETNEP